jgi:O-antigen/teichoic acid export membrane protein
MRNLITKILKDESLVGTIFVTAGLLVNSFFSYLLQVFLGRSFTVSDFGTYNALLSLFAILSVPLSVLSVSLVKVVSELVSHQKSERLTQLFWTSLTFLFFIGLGFITLLYLIRNPLAIYIYLPVY